MLAPNECMQYVGVEESGTPLAVWRAQECPASQAISVACASTQLEMADRPTRQEVLEQMKLCSEGGYEMERLERRLRECEIVDDRDYSEFNFLVWQLGNSFIVATSAEAHSPFQTELRSRFPTVSIAVLNITNGWMSYLPPHTDYELGSYQASIALYKSGSLDRIIESASQTIDKMIGTT